MRGRVGITLVLVAGVWLTGCDEPSFPTEPPVQIAPYAVKSDEAARAPEPEPPPQTADLVVGAAAKMWIGVVSAAAAIMLLVAVAVRRQGSSLWMVAALVPVAVSSFAVARLFHQLITGLAVRGAGTASLAAGIWETNLPLVAGLGGGAAIVLAGLLVPARGTPIAETSGAAIKVRRLLALLGILITGAAVLAVMRMSRLMFSPPSLMSIAEMTRATVQAMVFGMFASLFAAALLVLSAGLESFMRDHGSRRRRVLACAILLALLASALWWDWTFLRTLATTARTGRSPATQPAG